MSYLPFATLAYFLNSVAVTIDKFLLTKVIADPLIYIFYFSLLSLLSLVALPFIDIPGSAVLTLGSLSTLSWMAGAYLMFWALKISFVQRVVPVIGILTPLFLLVSAQTTKAISVNEGWAAAILVLALILLTLPNWQGRLIKQELILEILAAAFFAASYYLIRQAFLLDDFLTVFVWSKPVLIFLSVIILITPHLRKRLVLKKSSLNLKSGAFLLFLLGQTSAGVSELLLIFSISLANPAVINSLAGIKYVFLFSLGFVLAKKYPAIFKEKMSHKGILSKALGVLLLILGLYMLVLSQAPKSTPAFGVNYSPKYAHSLGLEPMITYTRLLDELKVKRIRLPVYWDEVEQFPHQFNFSINDFYLNEALKRDVQIILVLGHKQPRWPECFAPPWVQKLTRQDRQGRILELIKKEVEYYQKFPNISAWQIENEPFLSYGICDSVTDETYQLVVKEVEIVKRVDPRPILITDSGELGLWDKAILLSDIFGTTLYRQTWSKILGTQAFPLPPFFYTIKNQIMRAVVGKTGETIIPELQAEPWLTQRQDPSADTISEQASLMSVSDLKNNINYAMETNFSQIYLWGVEWWYFMAKNNHPQYLEYAKKLF